MSIICRVVSSWTTQDRTGPAAPTFHTTFGKRHFAFFKHFLQAPFVFPVVVFGRLHFVSPSGKRQSVLSLLLQLSGALYLIFRLFLKSHFLCCGSGSARIRKFVSGSRSEIRISFKPREHYVNTKVIWLVTSPGWFFLYNCIELQDPKFSDRTDQE